MIVEASISAKIFSFIKNSKETDPDKAIQKFSDEMATVIADAIKSATVTVNPGIPVSTAGSAVAQTGATIGTGTGTLS